MADSRTLVVKFVGDTRQLEAAFGKAQKKTSTAGKALATGAKIGAGALIGLGVAAKIGFDEMAQHQRVAAQTGAVLKSTGGAAHVTAKQVGDLANALLQKSGVDDEVIQSGENVLLTFRKIRNEAGKGNDIFNQATKATLDLSVALGKDMQSSSILVGKALNDPVKGLTALTRAGVQFSDGQVATIKHLVKTGDTMKAQKIILGELTAEFGGSAAAAGNTFSGQLSKARENLKNVAGDLTTALLPALNSLVSVLSSAARWMKQNEQTTKILVVAIAALSTGILVVNGVYKAWSAITKVVAAAQWLLNAALAANPIVLVVAAVIALGVALVIAYKKSQTFRNIVGAAVDFVKQHWQLLLALIPGIGPVIVLVIRNFRTLRNIAGSVFGFVANKVQTVVNVVKSLWGWVNDVISAVQSLINWIGRIHVPSILGGASASAGTSGGGGVGFGGHPNPQVIAATGVQHIHIYIGSREVASVLRNEQRTYGRQNAGRPLLQP